MKKAGLLRTFLATMLAYAGAIGAYTETAGSAERTLARAGARVFFIGLMDGATVTSRFTYRFGVSNMDLAPAGTSKPFSGHHHLLIDTPVPPVDQPIPNDANHLHFGRGQTEADVILPAGEHTLQLLLGDHDHVAHNPLVASEVIRVRVDPATVEKPKTSSPPSATVFFADLQDGATIPTKSVIKFGLSGMDLAPAGTERPNAGHHHLIIDAPTPDTDREIPSDVNHLHFGRGQTQAEVTLTPGEHTLQLVLGDHEHVPHGPPVMSPRIRVIAVEQGSPSTSASSSPKGRVLSPPDAAVYFVYPRRGETIYPNSTIRFGLKNMGVAPAGIEKANTGHHHLLIDVPTPSLDQPIPNDPSHLHFGNGQTEKKLTLRPGKHTLQLILGDAQHVPFDPPVMTERIEVTVMAPRKRKRVR